MEGEWKMSGGGRVAVVVDSLSTSPLKEMTGWPQLSRLPEVGHKLRTKAGQEAKIKVITHCEDDEGPYVELLVEPTTVMI